MSDISCRCRGSNRLTCLSWHRLPPPSFAPELLRHNADVNARDRDGRTPADKAEMSGRTRVLRLRNQYRAERATQAMNPGWSRWAPR